MSVRETYEASTTWRLARKLAPAIQVVRPVLRPPLRTAYHPLRHDPWLNLNLELDEDNPALRQIRPRTTMA